MLEQAKIKLRNLIYDDSGVAMAYTIMVFLFFFMLCVSTYSMTENIRQRMELQNACDAAAYSGAVVQADMLSRIAVLNRALSWTYYQTNKRHMDYIVDVWIDAVRGQHNKDSDYVVRFNRLSCHPKIPMVCYFASSFGGEGIESLKKELEDIEDFRSQDDDESDEDYENVKAEYYLQKCLAVIEKFNKNSLIFIININGSLNPRGFVDTHYWGKYSTLKNEIDRANHTMNDIEATISYLKNHISEFSIKAADHVLESSGYKSDDRTFAVFAGTSGVVADNRIGVYPRATYFTDVTTERELLAFSGHTARQLGAGYQTWWQLGTNNTQSGVYRRYTSGLSAGYTCFSTLWTHIKICVPIDIVSYTRTISPDPDAAGAVSISDSGRGADKYTPQGDSSYFTSRQTLASKLGRNFFGRDGSIVVAAKKPLANPFLQFFRSSNDAQSGLYGAFNGTGRDMWAVSAARAGLRFSNDSPEGDYIVQYPGDNGVQGLTSRTTYNSLGVWNLCEDDWDAVMLPVSRAWSSTGQGNWGNGSVNRDMNDLLSAVRDVLNINSNFTGFNGNSPHLMRH